MSDNTLTFRTAPTNHLRGDLTAEIPISEWKSKGSVRVPVVYQLERAGCAHACVEMVLRYTGRTRRRSGSDDDDLDPGGLSAQRIVELLRSEGVDARGVSVQDDFGGELEVPAILHWNFQHWVVLEAVNRRWADIVDPGLGRMRVDRDTFERSFTGVAVLCHGLTKGRFKAPWRSQTWKRYTALLPEVRDWLAGFVLLSACLQLLGLAAPLITVAVVDRVIPERSYSSHLQVGLLSALWLAVTAAFSASRIYTMTRVQSVFDKRAVGGFLSHILSLPVRYFQQRSVGDLLTRVQGNLAIRDALTSNIVSIAIDVPLALAYVALLARYDAGMALATLSIAAVTSAATLYGAVVTRSLVAKELQHGARWQGILIDALRGVSWVKASGLEANVLKRCEVEFGQQLEAVAARQLKTGMYQVVGDTMRRAAPVVLLLVGAVGVIEGSLSVAHLFGAISLASAAMVPLGSLGGVVQYLVRLGPQIERLDDVWSRDCERGHSGGEFVQLRGRVTLEHCTYKPSNAARTIISDVSIELAAGEFLAIVGPSGAGKSTLAALLTASIMPTAGRVSFDGKDVQALNLPHLRRQIGVAMQNAPLFQASVRDNIAVFADEVRFSDIEDAAARAGVHAAISEMPLGYLNVLREGASNISGGQRQRIALARALFRRPAILLLDEATSEVDSGAEQEIFADLTALGATRIVITHRLASVRRADRIAVIDGGKLVDLGTHQELMTRNVWYQKTAEQQGLQRAPTS